MTAKEEPLTKIIIESLSVRQALKYFILKERERHVQDIIKCDEDLKKLKDVELPKINLNTWIDV
jgi:hypothetical protein